MEKTFTRFLSYSDISVNEVDLLEDAFFSDIDYGAFMDLIGELEYEPSPEVVNKLLKKI